MAQLDLLGQAAGLPLYRLLGGRMRQRIRVYNTTTDYWAIDGMKMGQDTKKITQFLLDRGITGMKIYPFDAADHYLSNAALENGLKWIRDIRDLAANRMDICVDCRGRSDLASAQRIAKAIEPYGIMYLEDAAQDNVSAFARLAAKPACPFAKARRWPRATSSANSWNKRRAMCCMYDVTWCGGPWKPRRSPTWRTPTIFPLRPTPAEPCFTCARRTCARRFPIS